MALSLAVTDLDAGYGAVKALRGVTLHVEAGETVALLGTNGNGKSTLMKCIAGWVRPRRGSVSLTIDGTVHDLHVISGHPVLVTTGPTRRYHVGRAATDARDRACADVLAAAVVDR